MVCLLAEWGCRLSNATVHTLALLPLTHWGMRANCRLKASGQPWQSSSSDCCLDRKPDGISRFAEEKEKKPFR